MKLIEALAESEVGKGIYVDNDNKVYWAAYKDCQVEVTSEGGGSVGAETMEASEEGYGRWMPVQLDDKGHEYYMLEQQRGAPLGNRSMAKLARKVDKIWEAVSNSDLINKNAEEGENSL